MVLRESFLEKPAQGRQSSLEVVRQDRLRMTKLQKPCQNLSFCTARLTKFNLVPRQICYYFYFRVIV
jgi:hypothetical protein